MKKIESLDPVVATVLMGRMTEADNGTQVRLNLGDTLEITLPGNLSIGYGRQPKFDP